MYLGKDNPIIVTKRQYTAEEFIQKKIELLVSQQIHMKINEWFLLKLFHEQNDEAEPFYAVDLEDICNKHIQWLTLMPRVVPHYGK